MGYLGFINIRPFLRFIKSLGREPNGVGLSIEFNSKPTRKLFGILSRQGPLGGYGWLFTPTAIIVGQSVLAILLVQDIAIVPMIIVLEFFKETSINMSSLLLQVLGGAGLMLLVLWVVRKRQIDFPWIHRFTKDRESPIIPKLQGLKVYLTQHGAFRHNVMKMWLDAGCIGAKRPLEADIISASRAYL